MILIDTSVWIEFFRSNDPYMTSISELIKIREATAIACIFGELLQGVRSRSEAKTVFEYWTYLPKVDESNLWLEAGTLSFREKCFSKGVGLIDCALIASARKNSCKIWTLDKKLKGLLTTKEVY